VDDRGRQTAGFTVSKRPRETWEQCRLG
jgi:hypothetical protein